MKGRENVNFSARQRADDLARRHIRISNTEKYLVRVLFKKFTSSAAIGRLLV
jgi:hypothetical protein